MVILSAYPKDLASCRDETRKIGRNSGVKSDAHTPKTPKRTRARGTRGRPSARRPLEQCGPLLRRSFQLGEVPEFDQATACLRYASAPRRDERRTGQTRTGIRQVLRDGSG